MNFVQPIRDPEQIQQLKEYFKEKSLRNYILFIMKINTGLRISDILKLKVGDVKSSHISMREMKTGKQKRIQITAALKESLNGLSKKGKIMSIYCKVDKVGIVQLVVVWHIRY